jgi:hypothetical protein
MSTPLHAVIAPPGTHLALFDACRIFGAAKKFLSAKADQVSRPIKISFLGPLLRTGSSGSRHRSNYVSVAIMDLLI